MLICNGVANYNKDLCNAEAGAERAAFHFI